VTKQVEESMNIAQQLVISEIKRYMQGVKSKAMNLNDLTAAIKREELYWKQIRQSVKEKLQSDVVSHTTQSILQKLPPKKLWKLLDTIVQNLQMHAKSSIFKKNKNGKGSTLLLASPDSNFQNTVNKQASAESTAMTEPTLTAEIATTAIPIGSKKQFSVNSMHKRCLITGQSVAEQLGNEFIPGASWPVSAHPYCW
jgi:hypothetical protein